MAKSPWIKVDAKTHRLEARGHVAECRKHGAKWQVWINGEHQTRLDSSTVKWAKIPAMMMVGAMPEKRTSTESSSS